MTSFGWKKKKRLKTKVAAAFGAENNEEEEEKEVLDMIEVDWLTAVKRKKVLLLEDSKTKSKRYCTCLHCCGTISPSLIVSSCYHQLVASSL